MAAELVILNILYARIFQINWITGSIMYNAGFPIYSIHVLSLFNTVHVVIFTYQTKFCNKDTHCSMRYK